MTAPFRTCLRRFLVLPLLALAAACAETPETPVYPDITFSQYAPITLAVGSLETQNAYAAPLSAPNIEHTMPGAPLDAAQRWVSDRLRAGGDTGTATFTLKTMSVTETALEKTTGLTGALTTDQSERYDAVIEARLSVRDPARNAKGGVDARAERSITVPEDATLNERDQVLFELAEKLMNDFNAELEKNIRDNLSEFVVE
jgi:hypothetical protein